MGLTPTVADASGELPLPWLAAPLAAALHTHRGHALLVHGAPEGAERIVCVLTGHGLKDPQTALEQAGTVVPCEPDLAAVERAVLG